MPVDVTVREKAADALKHIERQRRELRKALGIDSQNPKQRAEVARQHSRGVLSETQDVAAKFGDILSRGPLNPERRESCRCDLLRFCKTYGGEAFNLPWSKQHHAVAELIQEAVTSGDMTAFAMPRASGKSTCSRWGVIWSILYRHSSYAVLIGATAASAKQHLKAIKAVLRSNEAIWQDFPDILACLRHVEGQPRRCEGQKYRGEATFIEWTQEVIVVPVIGGNDRLSWSVIDVTGITGEIRGRFHQLTDDAGTVLRPDLAIVDDPQTRRSARSKTMIADRLAVLAGDIKYMAGTDRPLGIVMPCTVIEHGDVADQLLDRGEHPEWHGSRTRFFERMPDDLTWWLDDYAALFQELERNDQSIGEATELYRTNQSTADAGFEPSWPARFYPEHGEISAIQHGMNAYIRSKSAFMAEYQNEPESGVNEEATLPAADFVTGKQAGFKRGECPADVSVVTAFADISATVLWWMVVGWTPRFDGYVLDYGAFPDQKRRYFTLGDIKRPLQDVGPKGIGKDGAIRWGLESLADVLLKSEFSQPDGTSLHVKSMAVDSAWGEHQGIVFDFCAQSKWTGRILPARGYGTKSPTFSKPQPGEIRGDHWRIAKTTKQRQRVLFIDANYWKSFAVDRLATHVGDRGCLRLFGDGREDHRMLADQLVCSEVRQRASIGEYVYWQFTLPPHGPDNHFLDCLSGCCVLGNTESVALYGESPAKKERVKLSELQRQKRGRYDATA